MKIMITPNFKKIKLWRKRTCCELGGQEITEQLC